MFGKVILTSFVAVLVLGAQDIIYFERAFPGAVPERFEVRLSMDGDAVYSEDGGEPLEFAVGEDEANWLFDLAAGLDHFSRPLASDRRVASTGRKVLRYESEGDVRGEAEFDYSEDQRARDVASWFVKLSATLQHLQRLERAYRFDRLGVNKAMVHLEMSYERNRIAAPELLEPILGKIATNERIMRLARARAEGLLERIRAGEHSQRH